MAFKILGEVGAGQRSRPTNHLEVPQDIVTIKGGRVQKVAHYWIWNNVDIGSSEYKLAEGGVTEFHFDPEHGGPGPRIVPIDKLDDEKIREAFQMNPVDTTRIRQLFPRHEIKVLD